MATTIREARESDAPACGRICFEAFDRIAREHSFLPDFPAVQVATGLISSLIASEAFFGLVAERDVGAIAGSNFLDERNPISGIGPITVDPGIQNGGIGRALMQAVIERSQQKNFAGTRLVQAGYHCRSLSLYSKLGFEVREHLSCLQGNAIVESYPGYTVRPAKPSDAAHCDALCLRVHGHHRGGELRDAISQGTCSVVERDGRISGYATVIAFFGHAVAETNDDLKALIAAAPDFMGPGFLVPSRNGEMLRWCLSKGLRVTQPLTLMTMGLYNEPVGSYLPSILY